MQSHRFRYLALVMLLVAMTTSSWASAPEEGFQSLFNGKNLDGWDGNPRFWRVEDGVITGQTTNDNPTKGNTFLIWRGGTVDDFELRLQFRIQGGNSGIQYRSKEIGKWVIGGYQADIDAGGRYTGILYEERGRGILVPRGKRIVVDLDGKKKILGETATEQEILASVKKDDWNDYTITARGNHIVQILNGKTTIDLTDEQESRRSMSGLLALQLHQGPPMKIQFRNIRLKRLASAPSSSSNSGNKKVVFVAGRRSHGYGAHEHNAGCLLLAKHLEESMPGFATVVYRDGWPDQVESPFAGADALVLFCDGGRGHMVIPHLQQVDRLMRRGVGLACIHYAVDVPKGDAGNALLDWIGGHYEAHWSVNPHWNAQFRQLPVHPITRGVRPFELNDEWYFHMRFRENMEGVTPILSAIAPPSTMNRRDGPNSGNRHVRQAVASGVPQHVAWAAERSDGGRGFGFTGGHFHSNWAQDDFRRLVLNAIVWVARGQVPADGVPTPTPTQDDLEANQDFPKPTRARR